MTTNTPIYLLLLAAVVAANLPWVTDRLFLRRNRPGPKGAAWRWLEWLLLYFVVGAIALGLERKINGELYPQGWEFYVVTLALFLVFALPGFLYRYEVLRRLQRIG